MVQRRKVNQEFFNQIDLLIEWHPTSNTINKCDRKGEIVVGRPSNEGIVLFKMILLQALYGLSEYEVLDRVNNRIFFSRLLASA